MALDLTSRGVIATVGDGAGDGYLETWNVARTPRLRRTSEGWDRALVELCGIFPGVTDASDLPLPDGVDDWIGWRALGEGKDFWCQETEFECEGLHYWTARLDCLGLLAPKVAKRAVSGTAEVQSAEDVIELEGGALRHKVQVTQRGVVLDLTYVQFEEPDTTLVGTMLEPDNPPPVPDSVWAFLTDPTWHWPYGWVLTDFPTEQLVNADAWLCRPKFTYVHRTSP